MDSKKIKKGNKECEILSGDGGLKDILQLLKEQSKKVETNMSIGYDGEASGGIDSTTASGSLGRGEQSLGKSVRFQERQVHCGCYLSCG